MDATPARPERPVPLVVALAPVVTLIGLLTLNVLLFGDAAIDGANQIALVAGTAVAALLAARAGMPWQAIEDGIVHALRVATPAILILLMVGALSGTWLLAGIVPAMINYGLYVLNPTIFLPAASLVCIVVSLATGSSWSTSATVGIALMGIGTALGMNPALVAGAVISGAYFGDKMSPLSDTTILASGVAGVDLFTHIRYMLLTNLPSITIALVLYLVIGLTATPAGTSVGAEAVQAALKARFDIRPELLLVPVAVVVMIWRQVPALPALFAGTVLGGVFALIYQMPLVREIGGGASVPWGDYIGVMRALFGQTAIATGNDEVDRLLVAGGMGGMLKTVWLIIAAMTFGGVMESCGFLARITGALLKRAHSTAGLVAATAGTCVFTNVSASDQYLAVVVPGRMFSQAFRERGLAPQNLSRTIEDGGTVTSVLVPWNTCGAYHTSVLGVATAAYAPFAFFCYLNPLMTMFFAWRGIRIAKLPADAGEPAPVAPALTPAA